MKVLVIGGTRFFGKRIVRKLLERGHDVAIFTRGHAPPGFWKDVESIRGDRKDYAGFQERLAHRAFDVVIDNIAYDGDDVQCVIQTFAGRIGHYLLCTSGAVYHNFDDWRQYRPFYEDEADLTFKGDLLYSEGKRAAELALWSLPEHQRPFPFTIMRPSVVEGPDDPSGRMWFWLQRVMDGQDVLVPQTTPTSIFRHAYAEDVAEAFVRAALNPAALNKAYNLAQEEILSLEDYVRALAHIIGQETRIVVLPLAWIRLQPGLSDFQHPFVGERFVQDIGSSKRDLGLTLTPMDVWFRQTVSWFVHAYHGADSEGYDKREQEVAAAQRWRAVQVC